jgi:uncharacterized protein (TIGR02145 family)
MIGKYFNLRKAIVITILLAGFSAGVVFAQETEVGVVINGVRWATRNLDVGGNFAETPETPGALYQWGRLADGHENRYSTITYELADSDSPGHSGFILAPNNPNDWRNPQNDALWNAGTEDAPVKSTNDPSPEGWRVPTDSEIITVLDPTKVSREWTTQGSVAGIKFTDNASNESIFFPVTGYRRNTDGIILGASTDGHYWSSRPNGIRVYGFNFTTTDKHLNRLSGDRAIGRSIRCVAETSTTSVPTVPAEDVKTIVGFYSITGQRLGSEPQSGFYIVVYDNGTTEKRMK